MTNRHRYQILRFIQRVPYKMLPGLTSPDVARAILYLNKSSIYQKPNAVFVRPVQIRQE